jgi:hypothetical protein
MHDVTRYMRLHDSVPAHSVGDLLSRGRHGLVWSRLKIAAGHWACVQTGLLMMLAPWSSAAINVVTATSPLIAVRRGGRSTGLGVELDVYWLSPDEMEHRAADAGFAAVFWGGRPAEVQEGSPQGYLLARRS